MLHYDGLRLSRVGAGEKIKVLLVVFCLKSL